MEMKRAELLAPAGDLEKLKTAIIYGADAVYIGGEVFGMRSASKIFSIEDMAEGVEFAHARGKKVYVTVNIIPHNEDFKYLDEYLLELQRIGIDAIIVSDPGVISVAKRVVPEMELHLSPHNEDFKYLDEYLLELQRIGIDAIIVSDPGVISVAKRVVPEMELHLSTQANTTNFESANFWYNQGIKRVVVAREMSFEEIREIREKTPDDLEIEAFMHGAMCISYSGRCLISNYMTGREANKGSCAQSCRWQYYLMEEKRPGEYFPIYEDERGTFFFNSKDLCMIEHIPELVESGIRWQYYLMEEKRPGEYFPIYEDERGTFFFNSKDLCMIEHIPELVESGIMSLKIEGRMKTAYYVATVVRA